MDICLSVFGDLQQFAMVLSRFSARFITCACNRKAARSADVPFVISVIMVNFADQT